jgi:glycosyltransferase involved in cell wall biosynthesis
MAALRKRDCQVEVPDLAIMRRQYFSPAKILPFAWDLLNAARRVARMGRTENFSVLYSATSAVLVGALGAKIVGRPHVWHLHEIIEKPRWFARGLAWLMARLAAKVVAVSGSVQEFWFGIEPRLRQNMLVIHNGLDLAYYDQPQDRKAARAKLGCEEHEVLIGCLGRIGTWKGQEVLLAALVELRQKKIPFRALVAGGTIPGQGKKFQEFKELIFSQDLQDRVSLLEFQIDTRPWLAAMDILVCPSVKPDPFPTVVLEGMAFALPVVATKLGGLIEMVADGDTGFLIPPQDSTSLAQRLEVLITQPELRKRMGKQGRQVLVCKFPLTKFEKQIQETINALEFSQ